MSRTTAIGPTFRSAPRRGKQPTRRPTQPSRRGKQPAWRPRGKAAPSRSPFARMLPRRGRPKQTSPGGMSGLASSALRGLRSGPMRKAPGGRGGMLALVGAAAGTVAMLRRRSKGHDDATTGEPPSAPMDMAGPATPGMPEAAGAPMRTPGPAGPHDRPITES